MPSREDIPEKIYHDEVVCFLADRYHTTPRKVLHRFFEQVGRTAGMERKAFRLEENELAILRDMTERNPL